MKDLNANRLMLAIRWNLLSQWKVFSRMMLGVMFGILAISFTDSFVMYSSGASDRSFVDSGAGVSLLFLFFFFIIVFSGSVVSYLKTTAQRAAYLMHPASNKEKFIVCWLFSTVVSTAVYIAAVAAADLLHMLFDMITVQRYYGSMTVAFFEAVWDMCSDISGAFGYVLHSDAVALPQFFMIVLMAFLVHAVFLFGGVFFRKQPWICTMGAIFIFMYIVSALGIPRLVFHFILEANGWSETARMALGWGGVAALLLLVALVYYAAYKVFCRMQVISNKWINI